MKERKKERREEKRKKETQYWLTTIPRGQLVVKGVEFTVGYSGGTDSVVCAVSGDELHDSTPSHTNISESS